MRRPAQTVLALLTLVPLAACTQSGLNVRNMSNRPMTLSQKVPGGEKSYTLDPGSSVFFSGVTTLDMKADGSYSLH